jgi:hypothetical protein
LPGGYELILPELSKMTVYTRTAIQAALIEGRGPPAVMQIGRNRRPLGSITLPAGAMWPSAVRLRLLMVTTCANLSPNAVGRPCHPGNARSKLPVVPRLMLD